ncbi:MAG: hypothetical protein K1X82_11240 [Bacteroidia bacterium]|nr:hypothetical protein [Bacteroidia bacterium]
MDSQPTKIPFTPRYFLPYLLLIPQPNVYYFKWIGSARIMTISIQPKSVLEIVRMLLKIIRIGISGCEKVIIKMVLGFSQTTLLYNPIQPSDFI